MNRLTGLLLSAAAGVAIAGGVAIGAPSPSTTRRPGTAPAATTPSLAPQDPAPRIGKRLPMGDVFGTPSGSGRPTDLGVAQTSPDPGGGAPWAVRTFQRHSTSGPTRVWCVQLGRVVEGRFVWITPGAEQAGPIDAGPGETTVCASDSPIAQHLGVMVASMADRPLRDLAARIDATVLWGVVDRPVRSARVDHAGATIPVTIHRHAFLKVLPGSSPATTARLWVDDLGGGTRVAIPPMFFPSLPVDPVRGTPLKLTPGSLARPHRGQDHGLTPIGPASLKQVATFSLPSSDVPQGLFSPVAGSTPARCYVEAMAAVAGRPVVVDRRTGLVIQPPLTCDPFPPGADRKPLILRGGGSSDDTFSRGTPAATVAYRRRVWERIPPGSASLLVSVPPGTTLLEVDSPVGVKTVRVGPSRVTRIGWVGQPEVQRALFPMAVRRKDGTYAEHFRGSVVARAFGADGKQIGGAMTVGAAAHIRR